MKFEPHDFNRLTLDVALDAVETALGQPLMGFADPLTSYINRVYEMMTASGDRVIAKFYRPGRWSRQALEDEHAFVADCAADDIPVIAPLQLIDGRTIGDVAGIHFVAYRHCWARQLEIDSDESYRRLGRLIARVHLAGERRSAPARVTLHPAHSTAADVQHLLDNGLVTAAYQTPFATVSERLLAHITPLFVDRPLSRIHGDLHRGNLLEQPDDGLMVIDFDDMAVGPPVQDIWMLLPDHAQAARREIDLILDGYEEFREFDYSSLKLIEPLRAMRMLYFLAWCSRQISDPQFNKTFPDWGSDHFWHTEVSELERQLTVIEHHCISSR